MVVREDKYSIVLWNYGGTCSVEKYSNRYSKFVADDLWKFDAGDVDLLYKRI